MSCDNLTAALFTSPRVTDVWQKHLIPAIEANTASLLQCIEPYQTESLSTEMYLGEFAGLTHTSPTRVASGQICSLV